MAHQVLPCVAGACYDGVAMASVLCVQWACLLFAACCGLPAPHTRCEGSCVPAAPVCAPLLGVPRLHCCCRRAWCVAPPCGASRRAYRRRCARLSARTCRCCSRPWRPRRWRLAALWGRPRPVSATRWVCAGCGGHRHPVRPAAVRCAAGNTPRRPLCCSRPPLSLSHTHMTLQAAARVGARCQAPQGLGAPPPPPPRCSSRARAPAHGDKRCKQVGGKTACVALCVCVCVCVCATPSARRGVAWRGLGSGPCMSHVHHTALRPRCPHPSTHSTAWARPRRRQSASPWRRRWRRRRALKVCSCVRVRARVSVVWCPGACLHAP
jgi:hypothetical protein